MRFFLFASILLCLISTSTAMGGSLEIQIAMDTDSFQELPLIQVFSHSAEESAEATLAYEQRATYALVENLAPDSPHIVVITYMQTRIFSSPLQLPPDEVISYRMKLAPPIIAPHTPAITLTISQWENMLLASYVISNPNPSHPLLLRPELRLPLPSTFHIARPFDGSIDRGILILNSVAPGGTTVTLALPSKSRVTVPLVPGMEVRTLGRPAYRIEQSDGELILIAERGYSQWVAWAIISIIGLYFLKLTFPHFFRSLLQRLPFFHD
ncbi:hypothetical protein Selin_2123 [Desulfurispirillum indicum S5]|uniref:Transmembrane protein n=1 Tax=Desulfurispirillum indicum (strain ATCC BAA-1389 / DSM 22839 / S5) TaxID=653733 RepID=E6W389_DESIS|nr:hypothetical protein [Desulfurispirillum indicum]ADU66843.1 hypothetical protein Selin_2123 [Desulfurispirillum indicum S5]